MPAYLSPLFNEPQVDANGNPLAGGKLNTYLAGSVSTPATAYTSSAGTVPQANPIVLNSRGVPDNPIWLAGGVAYKFVLQDASGVTLAPTLDNVQGINDPAAVASTQSEWVTLAAAPTFLSATSFSVPGDQTGTLQVARRLKTTNAGGLVYSTITTSTFAAGVTTVVMSNDASTLDAGLSAVSYGLLASVHDSVPRNIGALHGMQVISATGPYTPTPGTTSVVVELAGGGGAGGGTAATSAGQLASGAGGAAGGYAKSRLTAGFAGATVTIGAGGVAVSGATGGNGGTTSFGALFSATGGVGGSLGSAVAASTQIGAGASAGGSGVGGNMVNAAGESGQSGLLLTSNALSGAGGSSFFGGGAPQVAASAGAVAVSLGSGGGGAASQASTAARAGGNGAAGLCIVWEYA